MLQSLIDADGDELENRAADEQAAFVDLSEGRTIEHRHGPIDILSNCGANSMAAQPASSSNSFL
jgi:hypothetical protein